MRKISLLCLFAVVLTLHAAAFAEDAPPSPAAPSYEEELARVREELFAQYQAEAARGGASVGTRLAWSLIRIGNAGDETRVDLESFRHDAAGAELRVRHRGEDAFIQLNNSDEGKRVRAVVGGYTFTTGYSVLLQKPLGWMAAAAGELRAAGVAPDAQPAWELTEAPGGLIALAGTGNAKNAAENVPQTAFYRGQLRSVTALPRLPRPDDRGGLREDFREAAEALHAGVMGDESIDPELRQALEPVLAGTYGEIDPRDYFDANFCRRLIEADYLESFIHPLPPERAAELARYRETLAKVEAGADLFSIDLGGDGLLVAVARPGGARDPETGETLSPYDWRWEQNEKTVFHSPLPSRYLYAMSVAEEFAGRHGARPAGAPERTEVWHALLGRLAWYDGSHDSRAFGDGEQWQEAVEIDARGGRDPNAGPPGWSFPLFVPVRDGQGDPVLIATAEGVLPSPDFSAFTPAPADAAARRAAQDAWLDKAADVLPTPGELNLIYRIFFRYCSDSPLPELPNLIGSHLALSDTHQTVYETLDHRWAGRLAGDCDDMAEFFQNIAARQGRLVHVMQLPSHAAAGWLGAAPDVEGGDGGGYEFVVLQTGPALRFTADTRIAAVEKAYRHFDNDVGESQFSSSAVPLLLRFADEDTRTPFVLSARIYWDREYAEAMIKVQEYWHLNTFTAAIGTMERMIAAGDRDPGNLKELASLYEQVGRYADAATLRAEELAAAGSDELAALSTLVDAAALHVRAKDAPAALATLEDMRARLEALRLSDPAQYARTLAYRAAWAALLARLGEPERAWALVQHDVAAAAPRGENSADGAADDWRVSEPLLRILTALYERMALERDSGAADGALSPSPSPESADIRYSVRAALSHAFGKGYFRKDDAFNKIASRYYWLGRYGVAVAGRRGGLGLLAQDGPYPTAEATAHGATPWADRTEDLSGGDWEWFRVMPRLLLGLGLEMLDREEMPELHDPVAARRVLALIPRALERGVPAGISPLLGGDAAMQGALALSFIDNDLAAFTALMEQVRGKDYSSLYNNAAVMFGSYCGLVPPEEFEPWIAAFRTHFPGRQHYFKAAYRMLHKGAPAHAAAFARATAGFFPDDPLLTAEAKALATFAGLE